MANTVTKTSVKAKAKANKAKRVETELVETQLVKVKRVGKKDSKSRHNDNHSSKCSEKNNSSEPATKKTVVNKPLDVKSKTMASKDKPSKKKPSKTGASNWFLYMVEYADGRVYTGITTDVERRFAEHSSSGPKAAKALRGKGPLKLVFQQPMDNRSEASIAESAIKKLSKSDKRLLIQSGLFDRES